MPQIGRGLVRESFVLSILGQHFFVILCCFQRNRFSSKEQALTSVWKIPWVRRQRTRLRRPLQILLSPVLANYIKLVIKTSTIVADPSRLRWPGA